VVAVSQFKVYNHHSHLPSHSLLPILHHVLLLLVHNWYGPSVIPIDHLLLLLHWTIIRGDTSRIIARCLTRESLHGLEGLGLELRILHGLTLHGLGLHLLCLHLHLLGLELLLGLHLLGLQLLGLHLRLLLHELHGHLLILDCLLHLRGHLLKLLHLSLHHASHVSWVILVGDNLSGIHLGLPLSWLHLWLPIRKVLNRGISHPLLRHPRLWC
jgi:hypothetical protein